MRDCIVIGSGVAGLRAAIELKRLGVDVAIFTKDKASESNTNYAQGGIAVCLSKNDNFDLHIKDTLIAGAGLCNKKSVEILVKEGPDKVKELIDWGCQFDKNENGELNFTKEAAHSVNRILHANGDATGAEIERTLLNKAQKESIEINEHYRLIDLLVENKRVIGAKFHNLKENTLNYTYAKSVVLATGGYAAIYNHTTNPSLTTGDGIASAFLAGCTVEDMEFVQFHPTALNYKKAPSFLLSESMRGEGAILINDKGERFMEKYSKQLELAPRDIVARSIFSEMQNNLKDHVYLDISHLDSEFVKKRFPTIYHECLKYGLDITKEPIPVSPAAHYTMGGVKTDVDCKTNISGLFACGECACNGVHGANRLASNSMLEGLVYGTRAALSAKAYLKGNKNSNPKNDESIKLQESAKNFQTKIQNLKDRIFKELGIVRRLSSVTDLFECSLSSFQTTKDSNSVDIDYRNLLVIAILISRSCLERKNSVGAHYCIDTPWPPTDKSHVSLNIKDLEKWI
ncbi:L-aspartate oxidase [Desulfurella sp.]|uniref:L-aspartate oxidase n=1 Tax=Desulfurella sp. TaxID=1962857 RepID=UPI003D14017D